MVMNLGPLVPMNNIFTILICVTNSLRSTFDIENQPLITNAETFLRVPYSGYTSACKWIMKNLNECSSSLTFIELTQVNLDLQKYLRSVLLFRNNKFWIEQWLQLLVIIFNLYLPHH